MISAKARREAAALAQMQELSETDQVNLELSMVEGKVKERLQKEWAEEEKGQKIADPVAEMMKKLQKEEAGISNKVSE